MPGQVFSQEADDPIFSIGTGRTNYTERHGNFEIDDEVLQKLPLPIFSLQAQDVGSLHITFTTTEDPSLTVSGAGVWGVSKVGKKGRVK